MASTSFAIAVTAAVVVAGSAHAQVVTFRLRAVDGTPLPAADTVALSGRPTVVGQTLELHLTLIPPDSLRTVSRYLTLWPYPPCSVLQQLAAEPVDSGSGVLIAVDGADTVTAGCDALRIERTENAGRFWRSRDSIFLRLADDTTVIKGVWRADSLVLRSIDASGRVRYGTFVRQ